MRIWLAFLIALTTLFAECPLRAQEKPVGHGEVVGISGLTKGSYLVFAYAESPVYRFRYRVDIELANGRTWHTLPRFQSQHTDYDEPFEKAPVEMTVSSGGRLLVFHPFTGLPGELIEVTYLAPPAEPTNLYLVDPRSSGSLSKECWYTVRGLAQTNVSYTLHLKPGGHAVAGQLLDSSSVVVADLGGLFHGSVLIGTITPRTDRNQPQGRFLWTFREGGREFDGDWRPGEERWYSTGERIHKP